jgi:hypothetical protein
MMANRRSELLLTKQANVFTTKKAAAHGAKGILGVKFIFHVPHRLRFNDAFRA